MKTQPLLPRVVYQMCVHGALIVGSQAKRLVGETIDSKNSDWDLLIPYDRWQTIALLIPENARPNKFGGWRFRTDDTEVDIWPGDVVLYLTECKTKYGGEVVVLDYIHNRVFTSKIANTDNGEN